jgi:hypothetical protein
VRRIDTILRKEKSRIQIKLLACRLSTVVIGHAQYEQDLK